MSSNTKLGEEKSGGANQVNVLLQKRTGGGGYFREQIGSHVWDVMKEVPVTGFDKASVQSKCKSKSSSYFSLPQQIWREIRFGLNVFFLGGLYTGGVAVQG